MLIKVQNNLGLVNKFENYKAYIKQYVRQHTKVGKIKDYIKYKLFKIEQYTIVKNLKYEN